MEAKEIQKELLIKKTMATFDRYQNDNLYYEVAIDGRTYRFPISTIGDDVKGAAFVPEMRASELFRWIKKANENGDLVCLSENGDVPF